MGFSWWHKTTVGKQKPLTFSISYSQALCKPWCPNPLPEGWAMFLPLQTHRSGPQNPPLRPKASLPFGSPYFSVMVPNFFSMRYLYLAWSLITSLSSGCRERRGRWRRSLEEKICEQGLTSCCPGCPQRDGSSRLGACSSCVRSCARPASTPSYSGKSLPIFVRNHFRPF